MSSVFKSPANSGVVVAMAALAAFFLSIGAIAGMSSKRLATDLAPRLRGEVTVAIWGRGLESADAAAALGAELLTKQPGIQRVEVLEGDERDALIGTLIGGPSHQQESPRLISLDEAQPNQQLLNLMTTNKLTAILDDHRGFGGILERKAWTLAGLGLALCLLLFGGFAATCFVTGSIRTCSGNPRIELMIRLGAEPGSVAVVVGQQLVSAVLGGAIFGALCATLSLLSNTLVHGVPGSLAALVFSRVRSSDYFWLALCPVIMSLLGAATASLGARECIARRERDL